MHPLMKTSFTAASATLPKVILRSRAWSTVIWACLLLILLAPIVTAQDLQHSENAADLGVRSDVRVEPTSLGLNLTIPLRAYPGRSDLSLSASLMYSSKVWRMEYSGSQSEFPPTGGEIIHSILAGKYAEHSVSGWTSGLDLPWYEFTGGDQYYDDTGASIPEPTEFPPNWQFHTHYIRRMLVHMPDGSSHELRSSDQIFNGLGVNSGTYYSVDGSRLRYVLAQSTATLYLPDGSRFFYPGNNTVQLIDRNGNTLNFDTINRRWTDTLGRTISLPPMDNTSPGDRLYNLPGVGGSLTYTLRWKYLQDARTDPNQPLRYIGDQGGTTPSLFVTVPNPNIPNSLDYIQSGGTFNPVVLAEIILPNQTSYKFTYNVWGEIDKIVYPTGGYERMNYGEVAGLTQMDGGYAQANRGVITRFVSPSGTGADEAQWQYTTGGTTAPDGTLTVRYVHRSIVSASYGFQDPRVGLPYDERVLSATGQVLRRKLSKYAVTGAATGGYVGAQRNARVIKEVEILLDTGTNQALAKTTVYGYDTTYEFTVGVEQTSVEEYDYALVDQSIAQNSDIDSIPLGTLIRTTVKGYLTSNAGYRDRNILGLLSSTTIYKGSVLDQIVVSQSSVAYDETSLLVDGSVISWTDPLTSFRGNATTASQWLNTTGTYLQTHAQYNQCGGERVTTDAVGNQAQISYADSFSDGLNNRNTFAFPTSITSAVPDSSGVHGSISGLVTTKTYDFNTSLVTATKDANNQTTSYTYGDSLNRAKTITRPDGGLTTYNYNDVVGNFYVQTLTKLDATRNITAIQGFDGLGRPNRSFLLVASGSYSTSDTEYDSLGRVFRVSNPYFSSGLGSAINPSGAWTTNAYDSLSRVVSVTTADSAVFKTAYSGNRVLIADQNSSDALRHKRLSQSDALGRIQAIWEVTAPDPDTESISFPGWADVTAAYRTSYEYDTLSSLTKVTQGNQPSRIFVYDSMKRLVSATTPESGVTSYQYDNQGNLKVKTDARNVSTHYDYDGLNRVFRRWYNSDSSLTATTHNVPALPSSVGPSDEIKYFFDQSLPSGSPSGFVPAFSVGRVTAVTYGGGSNGAYYSYDAVGRPKTKIQQTGGINYQVGPRVYNFVGGVTTEFYPSGRVVNYTYDDAGRMNGVTGNLGDNTSRNYSTEISYTALGGLSQEHFGTTTPIYNKLFYNARGQLAEIREGLTPNDSSWQRGAIINSYSTCSGMCGGSNSTTPMTDNNGDLQTHQVFVPQVDDSTYQQNYTLFTQTYGYDLLNRLTSVQEGSWRQAYAYDRFGNRTIKTSPSETYGGVNNLGFEVEAGTNRLYAPGDLAITDQTLRRMQYDNIGNLKVDTYTYTGQSTRVYDADNRMTSANGTADVYTYDGEGQRVKRKIGATETWQVYGIGGELLAEYPATNNATPQREYGYRNGQLLITANVSTGGSWGPPPGYTGPNPLSPGDLIKLANLTELRTAVNQLRQNAGLPPFNFTVDPNPDLSTTVKADHIRQLRTALEGARTALGLSTGGYAHATLVEQSSLIYAVDFQELRDQIASAWNSGTGVDIRWVVSDQLGTPRMIFNLSGSLASVIRHDYLPFGEELTQGGRGPSLGYGTDTIRQKFAQKERDDETKLDYVLARYYASLQGRFTGADPLPINGKPTNPQNWNRYAYCGNNPLVRVDPKGLEWGYYDLGNGEASIVWFNGKAGTYKGRQYTPLNFGKASSRVITLVGGKLVEIFKNGKIDENYQQRATGPSPKEKQNAAPQDEVPAEGRALMNWVGRQPIEKATGAFVGIAVAAGGGIGGAMYAAGTMTGGTTVLAIDSYAVTSGAASDIAVVGSFEETSAFVGREGFNVLRLNNWTWERNVQWLDSIIRNGQSVLVRAGNKFTQQEIEYLLKAGYQKVGEYMIPPPPVP